MSAHRRRDDMTYNTIPPGWRLTLAVLRTQASNVKRLAWKFIGQWLNEFWPIIFLFIVEAAGIVMVVKLIIDGVYITFAMATSPLYFKD